MQQQKMSCENYITRRSTSPLSSDVSSTRSIESELAVLWVLHPWLSLYRDRQVYRLT